VSEISLIYYFYIVIEFILNDKLIRTDKPGGTPLVDFIRYEAGFTGTKIGCREGDCGACTVIEGVYTARKVNYKTIVSCLTPLALAHGKHIVTVEGLSGEALNPIQQAIIDHSGTQCGFCTPGFVVSLLAHCLSGDTYSLEETLASVDGNICRCTGYKSIERAVKQVWELTRSRNNDDPVEWMIGRDFLPDWFREIPARLAVIKPQTDEIQATPVFIGGGTDLMVQKADDLTFQRIEKAQHGSAKNIETHNNTCIIHGSCTVTEMLQSELLREYFPRLDEHLRLISSTPVRNMATVAGNIVNASPIADLAIFFLALDTSINLESKEGTVRCIPLKDFFKGYKQLDLQPDELVHSVRFSLPENNDHFNFEKVSKREFLDIASVNSAILVTIKEDKPVKVHLSAGGVAPVPLYLAKTCRFLEGKEISPATLLKAGEVLQEEILPISDIRGSAEYKRLLLRQLLFAHFIEMLPEKIDSTLLHQNLQAGEKH
jgi:xanthine dehydrogenase small subunit